MGGFTLNEPMALDDLKNFIFIFGQENREPASESGVPGRKLAALKLRRYEKIQEITCSSSRPRTLSAGGTSRPATGSQALQPGGLRPHGAVHAAPAGRHPRPGTRDAARQGPDFVQDLVDVLHGHRTNLLGLTTLNPGDEQLSYHAVNVALLAIVFGAELGLSKERLRELGLAGLFHDLGKAELDEALLRKRERLTAAERTRLGRAPRLGVRRLLLGAPLNMRTLQCVVSAHDHSLDYGHAVRDHAGEVHHIAKDRELNLFPRMALADAFENLVGERALAPELALNVMNTNLRPRFNPDLLRIFSELMKGYSQRVLTEGSKVELF